MDRYIGDRHISEIEMSVDVIGDGVLGDRDAEADADADLPMAAEIAAAPALAVMCEVSSALTFTLAALIVALSKADAPVMEASVSTPIMFSV